MFPTDKTTDRVGSSYGAGGTIEGSSASIRSRLMAGALAALHENVLNLPLFPTPQAMSVVPSV